MRGCECAAVLTAALVMTLPASAFADDGDDAAPSAPEPADPPPERNPEGVRRATQQIEKTEAPVITAAKRIPDAGVALSGRISYETWITGRVAGNRNIADVFGPGTGTQIDIGLILGKGVALFAGWQHAFYAVGSSSPYAQLPTANAYGNYFFGGIRYGCGNDTSTVGPWLGADLGYLGMGASGSDNSGGKVDVSLPNFAMRAGLGVCIRPTSGLVITPGAMVGLLKSTGSYDGSVTVGGKTATTSGDLENDSLIMSISPGLSITGEL